LWDAWPILCRRVIRVHSPYGFLTGDRKTHQDASLGGRAVRKPRGQPSVLFPLTHARHASTQKGSPMKPMPYTLLLLRLVSLRLAGGSLTAAWADEAGGLPALAAQVQALQATVATLQAANTTLQNALNTEVTNRISGDQHVQDLVTHTIT